MVFCLCVGVVVCGCVGVCAFLFFHVLPSIEEVMFALSMVELKVGCLLVQGIVLWMVKKRV